MHDLIDNWERGSTKKHLIPLSWTMIIGKVTHIYSNKACKQAHYDSYFLKTIRTSWISQLFSSSPSANLLTYYVKASSMILIVNLGYHFMSVRSSFKVSILIFLFKSFQTVISNIINFFPKLFNSSSNLIT